MNEERFNYYINKKDDRDWFIEDKKKEEEMQSLKEVVQVLNQQDQQIADLESKLAESEKTEDGAFWFEMWQHKKRDYDSVYKAYIENCAEVDQLKQQLKEKEKEIEYQESMKILAVKNQNQTAIAELEKVKEYNKTLVYSSSLIDKFIEQQIRVLKGETDGSTN